MTNPPRTLLAFAIATTAACHASTQPPAPANTNASASVTPAATSEMPESEVLAVLTGREWSADAPRVRALGPKAAPVLIRIADDGRADRVGYQRVRAILAMRHQHDDSTKEFLFAFVASDHDAPRMRAALDSLAVGFGKSDRDRVLDACSALDDHGDESVRSAARQASVRARLQAAM